MFKIITVFLCSLLLVSCASTGVKINPDDISKIKKGVTTESEVRAIFGSPNNVSLTSEGEKLFIYSHYKSTSKAENYIPFIGGFIGGSDSEMETFQIWFDNKGKVKSHAFNRSENETKSGVLVN